MEASLTSVVIFISASQRQVSFRPFLDAEQTGVVWSLNLLENTPMNSSLLPGRLRDCLAMMADGATA